MVQTCVCKLFPKIILNNLKCILSEIPYKLFYLRNIFIENFPYAYTNRKDYRICLQIPSLFDLTKTILKARTQFSVLPFGCGCYKNFRLFLHGLQYSANSWLVFSI